MTEEVKQEGAEPREYSAVEQEALDQGWVPKEEYEGDDSRYIDAPEFVRRGELFAKIEAQGKELKATKQAIAKLADHNKRIAEASYTQARKDLLAEKKQALLEGDADRLVEIDEQLDIAKEQKRNEVASALQDAQQQLQEEQPAFTQWKQDNSWYSKDEDLTDWADARGHRLAGQGLTPNEVLTRLAKEVKEKFPAKFNNPNRARAGAVESGRGSPRANAKDDVSLSADERRIMETIVRTGAMTREQYIQQLKALG